MLSITFLGLRRYYTCLTRANPLTMGPIVNIQQPLLITSNKIVEPLVITMRSDSVHAGINALLRLNW